MTVNGSQFGKFFIYGRDASGRRWYWSGAGWTVKHHDGIPAFVSLDYALGVRDSLTEFGKVRKGIVDVRVGELA